MTGRERAEEAGENKRDMGLPQELPGSTQNWHREQGQGAGQEGQGETRQGRGRAEEAWREQEGQGEIRRGGERAGGARGEQRAHRADQVSRGRGQGKSGRGRARGAGPPPGVQGSRQSL